MEDSRWRKRPACAVQQTPLRKVFDFAKHKKKYKIKRFSCFLDGLQYQQYDIATPEQRSVFP